MPSRTWFHIAGILLSIICAFAAPVSTQAQKEEDPEPQGGRFTNSIGMKFVLVKKGKFKMGSPKDEKDRKEDEQEHEVEITKDFHIGMHEVTQAQFKKVMGFNPSYFSRDGKASDNGTYDNGNKPAGGKDQVAGLNTDDFPVENVSWEDAQEFLKKLNALAAKQKRGVKYRLPTEAQWEYACRGGASSARKPFHFKSPSDSLSHSQANFLSRTPYGGGKKGEWRRRTCKVGSYEANGLGIYDMHGNVWEWCEDWYGKDYYATSAKADPSGSPQGSDRVLRGGSWLYIGYYCRAAHRYQYTPSYRYRSVGFRVAAVPTR